VTATDLVDRLAGHKTLGAAPREELEWLASHGTLRHLAEGDLMSAKGQPVEGFFVILTGRAAIFLDRGAGRHKVMEWPAGDVSGVLPYSRLINAPGDVIAQEPTEVLAVPRNDLPAMIRECQVVTSICVHRMLDRARLFTSSDLHDEKMISLGKLSAGLAHEINNPASAIERGAALLSERLNEAGRATRALGAAGLTADQLAAVDALRDACVDAPERGVLSPIQRAEREEAIADWLEDRGIRDVAVAGGLSDTGVALATLDRIDEIVGRPALEAVIRSVAAECSVRSITSDIQEAATRIAVLVMAVKGFTHMDQAAVAGPVDLAASLGNTVAVLKSKARGKSAAVTLDFERDLPRVRGFAGELNQIWANLIDNALDAVAGSGRGHVGVTAKRERDRIVVRVSDDGPGIPSEVVPRIFDPFFTTKPVGQGTGLGLDIVRRLLAHNDAEIEVESAPGRTEFRVSLPVDDEGA
jgi:signal transduction histidine kinase